MHICNHEVVAVEGGIDISIIHVCILKFISNIITLEQYYYIALYRQQIATVWLGRE